MSRISNNQVKLLKLLNDKKQNNLRNSDLKKGCFFDFKSFYRSINKLISKEFVIKIERVEYRNRFDYEITVKGRKLIDKK